MRGHLNSEEENHSRSRINSKYKGLEVERLGRSSGAGAESRTTGWDRAGVCRSDEQLKLYQNASWRREKAEEQIKGQVNQSDLPCPGHTHTHANMLTHLLN